MPPPKRPPSDVFRKRLRERMQALGLNNAKLARKLRVSEATVSRWFSDDEVREPSASVLARMPAVLHSSVDWLLGVPKAPEPFRIPPAAEVRALRQAVKKLVEGVGAVAENLSAILPPDDDD